MTEKIPDLFLGIDLGASGAYALISDQEPTKTYSVHSFDGDMDKVIGTLIPHLPFVVAAAFENVNAHIMGRTSAFSFGRNIGSWDGVLRMAKILLCRNGELQTFSITPEEWQKIYFATPYAKLPVPKHITKKERDRLKTLNRKQLKTHSIKSANTIFEGLELGPKDDGKADAMHLALAARDFYYGVKGVESK